MKRLLASAVLLARFLGALVASGIHVLRAILRAQRLAPSSPADHFICHAYVPMSPTGAAILACLVSLTPGSTVVRLDLERREMIIHLLEPRSAAAVAQEIRERFEPPLVVLFGPTADAGATHGH